MEQTAFSNPELARESDSRPNLLSLDVIELVKLITERTKKSPSDVGNCFSTLRTSYSPCLSETRSAISRVSGYFSGPVVEVDDHENDGLPIGRRLDMG